MRDVETIADELHECAVGWEPQVRLVGNVRADEIAFLALCMTESGRAELYAAVRGARNWLERVADQHRISEFDYQELACILEDAPTSPGDLEEKARGDKGFGSTGVK